MLWQVWWYCSCFWGSLVSGVLLPCTGAAAEGCYTEVLVAFCFSMSSTIERRKVFLQFSWWGPWEGSWHNPLSQKGFPMLPGWAWDCQSSPKKSVCNHCHLKGSDTGSTALRSLAGMGSEWGSSSLWEAWGLAGLTSAVSSIDSSEADGWHKTSDKQMLNCSISSWYALLFPTFDCTNMLIFKMTFRK